VLRRYRVNRPWLPATHFLVTCRAPYAVLSISGFLGMATHLIVVPYDSLKLVDNKIVLPGRQQDRAAGRNEIYA
jgi:hypothetical protein